MKLMLAFILGGDIFSAVHYANVSIVLAVLVKPTIATPANHWQDQSELVTQ